MPINHLKPITKPFKAKDYILHKGLENAVEVALALGQPLLLTGEPGTGKTKLAYKVAEELSAHGFNPKPLEFNTKTTSTARDLFYTYDAVAHFQAANIKREDGSAVPQTVDFVELQALGKAIAYTNKETIDLPQLSQQLTESAVNSVVLIDEIDKAPRDFTNDILNEIERYEFRIKEINQHIQKNAAHQVLIIMTSNSEKNFPDAFLRRCVFYHIPFPNKQLLMEITLQQLGEQTKYTTSALDQLLDKFGEIRSKTPRKSPATAELIAWLQILEIKGYDMNKDYDVQKNLVLENLSVLVKTKEDLDAIETFLNG